MAKSYPILQSELLYIQTWEKENLSDGQMIKHAGKKGHSYMQAYLLSSNMGTHLGCMYN
jgi:hypothetical protein